tara:strand:+ start:2702 stop:3415 length:714 start_codon:yes stop_codon:yes gene_type:complete
VERDANSTGSFFSELRRRKVIRTCALYIFLCWGVLQVLDIVAPAMGYDGDLISRYFLYIAVLGFPVTFALSWFFHITSHGIVRTDAFVERRVLSNLPPINERRHGGVSTYFHKGDVQKQYRWIISAETGPLAGLSFGLDRSIVLGRSMDCDIAIVTPHVSRQHARLELEDSQLCVEDLGSSNGTMVNGKPAQGRQLLHHEDELRFHDIVFRVSTSFSGPDSESQTMNKTTFINPPSA